MPMNIGGIFISVYQIVNWAVQNNTKPRGLEVQNKQIEIHAS